MTGGAYGFVTLKGSSLLSCTGTMDQGLSSGMTATIGFIHGDAAAKGREWGIPTLYNTPVVNLIPSQQHLAAKGEGS